MSIKSATKEIVRSLLPLSMRKSLAVWVNQRSWLDSDRRSWWSLELVRDLASLDINEYHKFLWSNHLAYSAPYEVSLKFGEENVQLSRKFFFSDLTEHLAGMSLSPERDIRSVFEVGCSLGYQLKYCETDIFPAATDLEGTDIDRYAIESGTEYLRSVGSKVRLTCADMEELDGFMGDRVYDVIICSGVLMYLSEDAASRVVDVMMRHTGAMLAMMGLAHPDIDNSRLPHSVPRDSDQSFIHNIDAMVENAGGKVIARRWEGSSLIDGHTIYFVFATKPTRG